MKKVEAIIRTAKFEEVHTELAKIGIRFMTYSEVKGIGMEPTAKHEYRGAAYDIGFIPRIRLEIAVSDDMVDKLIDCLLKTAYTGKVGDGKIFVYDVAEVYRIRTKEKGDKAL
ncbi:MAG TPA: P-II family nitrogen regulator [Cyclobacteriaceae bacterium]|jgi:nitrogen regulatory protein P-II 1|nr:P-II family nitrogen regulator [Cyclobacteriaceae bacterium]